jgi:hypothetical protein
MTSFFDFKDVNAIKYYYGVDNYYSQNEINEAKKSRFCPFYPSFSKRPWVEGSRHPFKNTYYNYLLKTPFKNNELQKDERSFKMLFLEKLFWFFE